MKEILDFNIPWNFQGVLQNHRPMTGLQPPATNICYNKFGPVGESLGRSVEDLLVSRCVGGETVGELAVSGRWVEENLSVSRWSIGGGQPVAVSVVGWRWPVGDW